MTFTEDSIMSYDPITLENICIFIKEIKRFARIIKHKPDRNILILYFNAWAKY